MEDKTRQAYEIQIEALKASLKAERQANTALMELITNLFKTEE